MADRETKFVTGLWVDCKEDAPDWVLCEISVKSKGFVEWLRDQEHTDKGYLKGKLCVKRSKGGKVYIEHFIPTKAQSQAPSPQRPVSAPDENTDSGVDGMDHLPF